MTTTKPPESEQPTSQEALTGDSDFFLKGFVAELEDEFYKNVSTQSPNANSFHDYEIALDRAYQRVRSQFRRKSEELKTSALAEGLRLIASEKITGQVVGVTESEVVIRFDPGETEQDVFDEAYERSKFNLGHTPLVGDPVEFDIQIRLIATSESPESARSPDDAPHPRRNVITGDHRF